VAMSQKNVIGAMVRCNKTGAPRLVLEITRGSGTARYHFATAHPGPYADLAGRDLATLHGARAAYTWLAGYRECWDSIEDSLRVGAAPVQPSYPSHYDDRSDPLAEPNERRHYPRRACDRPPSRDLWAAIREESARLDRAAEKTAAEKTSRADRSPYTDNST